MKTQPTTGKWRWANTWEIFKGTEIIIAEFKPTLELIKTFVFNAVLQGQKINGKK